MKFVVNVLALLCIIKSTTGIMKCGVLAPKCVTLSSGKVYWSSNWTAECSSIPICPNGYRLQKQMIGSLRACCCVLKRMEDCPLCDMLKVNQQTFNEWIDMHLKQNGPPDGKCSDGTLKRIFYGKKLDKCCCEPENSPYLS